MDTIQIFPEWYIWGDCGREGEQQYVVYQCSTAKTKHSFVCRSKNNHIRKR